MYSTTRLQNFMIHVYLSAIGITGHPDRARNSMRTTTPARAGCRAAPEGHGISGKATSWHQRGCHMHATCKSTGVPPPVHEVGIGLSSTYHCNYTPTVRSSLRNRTATSGALQVASRMVDTAITKQLEHNALRKCLLLCP